MQRECFVQEGEVTDSILSFAEAQRVDLIVMGTVMGTHGRKGFDRVTLGSVAEKALRKARCPVLVVREAGHEAVAVEGAKNSVECEGSFSARIFPTLPAGLWIKKGDLVPPAVETVGLTRRFGAVTAVSELSLSVPACSIFGLPGPNGAGKTTTIKMLTTMLPPNAGSARVSGFEIVHQPVEIRRSIGYVSQMLSAHGALTGYAA